MIRCVSNPGLLLFSLSAACVSNTSLPAQHSSDARVQVQSVTSAAQDVSSSPAKLSPDRQERSEPDAFLVHTAGGKIELRTARGKSTSELAAQASLTIYDAARELIWFQNEDRLNVIDLRSSSWAPIEIVRGVPDVSVLEISRPDGTVRTMEACQAPSFTLLWQDVPGVDAYDRDTNQTHITGSSWLHEQLDRPARKLAARHKFEDRHLHLPRKLLDCEGPSGCPTSATFGAEELELVLVRDKSGGDCWNRACIVRDPRTNRYASPPDLQNWTTAAKAKPGPCGLYYFDQAQRSYLVGNRVCVLGSTCEKLHGQALGWLQGGDIAGDIGDTGDEDDDVYTDEADDDER